MQISEEAKRYLSIYGVLVFIVVMLYLIDNQKGFSCDEWAADFRDDVNFNMVVSKIDTVYGARHLNIIDLETKESSEYYDGGHYLSDKFDKFNVGDTLIKETGKYTIVIKRKGKTILIPFTCDKKIYLNE